MTRCNSLPNDLPEGAYLIHDAVRVALVETLGLADDVADQAAYDVLSRVLGECGGEYFYVPKDIRLAMHRRDVEIWSKFTGNNHMQLAREYGLTKQYIYRIIARMREAEFASRQGALL